MHEASTIGVVAHVIQLAVAPVFLLTAIGTLLSVMTNRLSRIIERARSLEARLETAPPESISAHCTLHDHRPARVHRYCHPVSRRLPALQHHYSRRPAVHNGDAVAGSRTAQFSARDFPRYGDSSDRAPLRQRNMRP